jgi:ElaB/YqjD/DUF883 family membrane-anchored ribosome-binding protein
MSKNKKKDPQAKLEKARDRLAELEAAYARTQAKAEKRVREAQEKGDRAVAKARERVEAQREVVAQREGQVAPAAPSEVKETLHSPEVAADRLAAAESNGDAGDGLVTEDGIVLPQSAEGIIVPERPEPPWGSS